MSTHCQSSYQKPETPAAKDAVLLSPRVLARQNSTFRGSGGVSNGNANHGFLPAFMDQITGVVYLSRFADGTGAPIHVLDGLPKDLVAQRSASGRVTAVKAHVLAGFLRNGLFYTREQAAKVVASATDRNHFS